MTPKDIAVIITAIAVPCLMFLAGAIYHLCNYIKSKRPHKSDDEEDNPIVKFKDDLAEIYESNPNGKLKKLAQAVWNRVEEIEKWHNAEIHDWERKYYSAKYSVGELDVKCDGYREELDEWTQRCEELQSKLNESQERLKRESAKVKTLESETDKLRDMLKEEHEKNKIPIFSDQTEVPAYLISENTFGSQINPFAKVILNTNPGEPLTATEATELAERLQRIARQPIVLDSETLNDTQIKNEEFIKQLRDWWGLEAQKAVEIAMPETDKKKPSRKSIYDMSNEEMQGYFRDILIDRNVHNLPLNRYKVEVFKSVDNGRRAMLTEWILPATSINAIRNVLGEEGIQVVGAEELP